MNVKNIEIIVLSVPLINPIKLSFGEMKERQHLIIKLTTLDGIDGYGEVWTNFPKWNIAEKLILLKEGILPLIASEDFTSPYDFYSKLKNAVIHSGAYRQWGARGHIMQALSGIDIAFWDAYGKTINKPVYQILSASPAKSIDAYASGFGPDNFLPLVEKAKSSGYNKFKLKVGFGDSKDVANLSALRSLVGKDKLFIDANQGYKDYETAISSLSKLDKFDFDFIEEPVLANQYEDFAKIRQKGYIVAGGENLYEGIDFTNALRQNCLDVIQPDVTKTGGITEFLDILSMTKNYGKPFAPHMFGTAIGQVASLNILASCDNGMFMEVDGNGNPFLTDFLASSNFIFNNGKFDITDKLSGLGLELSKDFIEKYRIDL